ncbi:hypothetical protein MLD38_031479 [Melastoma candidum]|uniref:Uncharacterized protein n=1 Tax=Melastoma candidum TaxID=119954 RepID=A0ACB9MPL9_9MYRT|nr:hypothetical protein MLD38_031479 [Melastoma candidum]
MNLSSPLGLPLVCSISPSRSVASSDPRISTTAHNVNFAISSRLGAVVQILKDCSISIPTGDAFGTKWLRQVHPLEDITMHSGLGDIIVGNRELILSRVKVHLNALKKYTYGKHIVARVEKLVAAGARKVLLLDELTTSLDETDQIGVIKAGKNCLDESDEVTGLWATHLLEELEYVDGALYMEDGSLRFLQGSTSHYAPVLVPNRQVPSCQPRPWISPCL